MNADADLDLLGVLVTRRDRLVEVASVLRRYGFASIAAQLEGAGGPAHGVVASVAGAAWLRWRSLRAKRSGAPSAVARLRLAERVIRSARRPAQG